MVHVREEPPAEQTMSKGCLSSMRMCLGDCDQALKLFCSFSNSVFHMKLYKLFCANSST